MAYQLIGHYKSIKQEDRYPSTISDGMIFRTQEEALAYGRQKMHHGFEVREIKGASYYVDPETGQYVRVKGQGTSTTNHASIPAVRSLWRSGRKNLRCRKMQQRSSHEHNSKHVERLALAEPE